MNKIMHLKVLDSCCRLFGNGSSSSGRNGNPRGLSNALKSMGSMILLFVLFLWPTVSSAQITIDGNPADWNSAVFNTFPIRKYVFDPRGTGVIDNQFTSSKYFFLADGTGNDHLTWVMGQTKAKNDIANAAALLDGSNLYFAGDRTSNNGDAQIGFWFFLGGTSTRTIQKGTRDFAPDHAVGDLLVLADFTGGGRDANVTVYEWVGTG